MSDTAELPLADLPPEADEPVVDTRRPTSGELMDAPVHGPDLPFMTDRSLVPAVPEAPPTDDELIAGLRKELGTMSPDGAENPETTEVKQSPLIPILEDRLKEVTTRRERKGIMKQIYELQNGGVPKGEKPTKEKVFKLAKMASSVAAVFLILLTFIGFKSGGRQQ